MPDTMPIAGDPEFEDFRKIRACNVDVEDRGWPRNWMLEWDVVSPRRGLVGARGLDEILGEPEFLVGSTVRFHAIRTDGNGRPFFCPRDKPELRVHMVDPECGVGTPPPVKIRGRQDYTFRSRFDQPGTYLVEFTGQHVRSGGCTGLADVSHVRILSLVRVLDGEQYLLRQKAVSEQVHRARQEESRRRERWEHAAFARVKELNRKIVHGRWRIGDLDLLPEGTLERLNVQPDSREAVAVSAYVEMQVRHLHAVSARISWNPTWEYIPTVRRDANGDTRISYQPALVHRDPRDVPGLDPRLKRVKRYDDVYGPDELIVVEESTGRRIVMPAGELPAWVNGKILDAVGLILDVVWIGQGTLIRALGRRLARRFLARAGRTAGATRKVSRGGRLIEAGAGARRIAPGARRAAALTGRQAARARALHQHFVRSMANSAMESFTIAVKAGVEEIRKQRRGGAVAVPGEATAATRRARERTDEIDWSAVRHAALDAVVAHWAGLGLESVVSLAAVQDTLRSAVLDAVVEFLKELMSSNSPSIEAIAGRERLELDPATIDPAALTAARQAYVGELKRLTGSERVVDAIDRIAQAQAD